MKQIFAVAASIALAAGCQASTDDVDVVIAEPNELGISHVEIQRTTSEQDPLMIVRGFDSEGGEVASAALRTGQVVYSPEPDVIQPKWSDGTELDFRVQGKSLPAFVTPDRHPHSLRLPPGMTDIAAFMHLDAVGTAIEDEAGIWVEDRAGDEIAYSGNAANCDSWRFPSSKGGPAECCQDNTFTYHRTSKGGGGLRWAFNPEASWACRYSEGATGCGIDPYGNGSSSECVVGPCGYGITFSSPTSNTKAFHPDSAPSVCGFDSDSSGGGWEEPETYVSQTPYDGAGASCPYTECCTDGSPATSAGECSTCAKKRDACGDNQMIGPYGGCYSCNSWYDTCQEYPWAPGCECFGEICG